MEISSMIMAGVIICLAGMTQSAVGFGYALFATPLLVWIGMPLPSVITLVATCSLMQAVIGVRTLHAVVPWRLSLAAAVIGLASVTIGLILLKRLAAMNMDHVQAVVGGILCLLVTIQFFSQPRPFRAIHWGWGGFAFIGSGLLTGLCGMGGPPLVMWSMAHDWSTEKTRGFLFAVFAMSIPFQIVMLGMTFGMSILWNVAIGIAFAPLVYLGAIIGLPIGNRMAKDRLRHIAYAILLAIGCSSVIPAILAQLS